MTAFDSEEIIRFVTAIFENPSLYDKTYTVGGIKAVFRLPSYTEATEMQRIITSAIAEKTIASKRELQRWVAIYKLAISLYELSLGTKTIYRQTGLLKDRVTLLETALRTHAAFQLLNKLRKDFESHYRALIEFVSQPDFFGSPKSLDALSATS